MIFWSLEIPSDLFLKNVFTDLETEKMERIVLKVGPNEITSNGNWISEEIGYQQNNQTLRVNN